MALYESCKACGLYHEYVDKVKLVNEEEDHMEVKSDRSVTLFDMHVNE